MSHKHNQIVAIWEDIEEHFRCVRLKRDRQLIVNPDLDRVRCAYTLFILALDDLLSVEGKLPFSWDYKRLIIALSSLDVIEVMQIMKVADEILLSVYHGQGNVDGYDGFKRRLLQKCPKGGAILAPLKEPIAAWSLNPGDCTAFFQLHCAFCFMSRIRFDRCEDLKEAALQDYLRTESSFPSVFTEEEGGFFAEWFPDTPEIRERLYSAHVGDHGPGAVADVVSKDFVKKHLQLGCDGYTDYLDMVIGHDPVPWMRGAFERTSKVIFVAKTATKLRTICSEPATLQFYEQGFRNLLYDFIGERLRRRIDLVDQSCNRQLAKEGSITGDLTTIDLSAASDSIAYDMIRQWTYNTALSPMILACRSTHAELPSGQKVRLNKFAPMGSALCFPMMCLVFCSIVEAAITEYGDRYEFSRYRVYGDDIVVETRYVPSVIRRLTANGFKVNVDKSFFHADAAIYRESCGGEYLNGTCVTPTRLSRRFDGWLEGISSPEAIERLVALCNSTFGVLPSVRSFVITKLLKLPKAYQPLFSDNQFLIGAHIRYEDQCVGVYSPSANNYHLNHKWNDDLQRSMVQTYTRKYGSRLPDGDDGEKLVYEYLKTAREREALGPEDRISVRDRRTTNPRLGTRWV